MKNYMINNYSEKCISNIKTSPLGLSLYINSSDKISSKITAENVGAAILPIVEYIRETKPDYIVASDRGARIIGIAVAQLYKRLHGNLPTVDGSLRFRRFSKSNTFEETREHVRGLAEEMLREKEKPYVLVLDDWVCSGGTKELVENVFNNLSDGRIQTKFAVFTGSGADVSGKGSSNVDWHNNIEIIGVNYSKSKWTLGISKIKAHSVRGQKAINYRQRMIRSINDLVDRIRKDEIEELPHIQEEHIRRVA